MTRLVMPSLLVTLAVHTAEAEAQCGSFTADNGNNTIIVGETYNRIYVLGSPVYIPRNRAGVCWEDQNGVWQFTDYINCNNTTPANNPLMIDALGGDDIVSVHTGSLFPCTATPGATIFMGAFSSSFAFGINATMGAGADEFYGSPNADTAFTMTSASSSNDSAIDLLCGYGGNDSLFGDTTDTSTDYECLVGGDGTEVTCNGRGTSSPERDFAMSCDGSHSSARVAETAFYECTAEGSPIVTYCPNPCFSLCPSSPPTFR